jgi:hypothetical protein
MMIQVFCDGRGSGKTKALINMANNKVNHSTGDVVYIDDDTRPILQLDRKIRFVATEEFNINDHNTFYGLLCGMISEDYDIQTIFIDGLFNIIPGKMRDAAHLFLSLERMSQKYGIEFYININSESKDEELPEFIKKYVA